MTHAAREEAGPVAETERLRRCAEVRRARALLGLSADGLATRLELGRHGGRTIRRYEAGDVMPSGPVLVALRFMVAAATTKETG